MRLTNGSETPGKEGAIALQHRSAAARRGETDSLLARDALRLTYEADLDR